MTLYSPSFSCFPALEAELERYEREHPTWNVDNMSKDKVSKTIINKGGSETEKSDAMDIPVNCIMLSGDKNCTLSCRLTHLPLPFGLVSPSLLSLCVGMV